VDHERAIGGRGGVVATRPREGGGCEGHGRNCTEFVQCLSKVRPTAILRR
jgi:hypothetical protein